MKQHKDIREILKRSGTAPTGICGFWRSSAGFAAVLFGAFSAFKFLAGVYLGAGGFLGFCLSLWLLRRCRDIVRLLLSPRGCPRAVSSAAVLLTFNTLQLWEKSHCYSQERVTTPTYRACGRIRSSFSTALTTCVSAWSSPESNTHNPVTITD